MFTVCTAEIVISLYQSYLVAIFIIVPDVVGFCLLFKTAFILSLSALLQFLYLTSKRKDFTGVFINCSNGLSLHINCIGKTKVLEIRELMSLMLKVQVKVVCLFHHGIRLLDMIEIGGQIFIFVICS